MKTLTVTYERTVDTEHGKKLVFSSKAKGEWAPKSIGDGVDISALQPKTLYSITFDDDHYWTVTKITAYAGSPAGGGFAGGRKPWSGQPYDMRQFVSNCLGQAVQARLIEKPEDLDSWARYAVQTALFIDKALSGEEEAPKPVQEEQPVQAENSSPDERPAGPLTCPKCGRQTLRPSKFNTGWYCASDCKAKFGGTEPRITIQYDKGGPRESLPTAEEPGELIY